VRRCGAPRRAERDDAADDGQRRSRSGPPQRKPAAFAPRTEAEDAGDSSDEGERRVRRSPDRGEAAVGRRDGLAFDRPPRGVAPERLLAARADEGGAEIRFELRTSESCCARQDFGAFVLPHGGPGRAASAICRLSGRPEEEWSRRQRRNDDVFH